jgi:hypothetical protein
MLRILLPVYIYVMRPYEILYFQELMRPPVECLPARLLELLIQAGAIIDQLHTDPGMSVGEEGFRWLKRESYGAVAGR